MKSNRSAQFDLELARGEVAEDLAKLLFTYNANSLKVEVKRDFKISETGNVAIEYRQECFDGQEGIPSGIAITKADWWIIFLDGPAYNSEIAVIIQTKRLKHICRHYFGLGKRVPGGDNGNLMVLVPVAALLARTT